MKNNKKKKHSEQFLKSNTDKFKTYYSSGAKICWDLLE